MGNDSESKAVPFADLFGTKDLIQLIVKKLSSQALLFGLVFIIILLSAYKVFGNEGIPIIGITLFVFLVATAGYLFFEQKGKIEREDPATVNRLLMQKMESIESPDKDFSVRVWTAAAAPNTDEKSLATARDIGIVDSKKNGKGAGYRIGEKIDFCFSSSRDCYLTLLNVGTSGKLTVLFPNSRHPDNRITAGQVHTIPGREYGFEFQLQGPPGIEKLKAIAMVEKIELLETNFAPDGSMFRTQEPSAAARDIVVIKKKINALPAGKWAEATCEFKVDA